MSNVYSIISGKQLEPKDFEIHRKSFPASLNKEVEKIMSFIEYSLYTLAMSGFDITNSIMVVPFDETPDPPSTVAVVNAIGDKDIDKQRDLILLTHKLILNQDEAASADESSE